MKKQLTIAKLTFATSFILLVLVAVAFRADQTLARLAGVAAQSGQSTILSREIQLTASDLVATGTLDGLQVLAGGLVLVPDRLEGSLISDPVHSPLGFTTDIVPLWQAQIPDGTSLRLETRLSADGGESWSGWLDNPEAFYPVRGQLHSGKLLWAAGENVVLQVKVTLRAGPTGDSPQLDALQLVFNDTSKSLNDNQVVVAFNAASTQTGKPGVVSRTDWGNPDGQDSPRRPPQYAPVTHVIIHQTETSNSTAPYQDYSGWVRAIWNFHANVLGWGDIGYNYLIDPNGVIYEGRAGGDEVIGIHDSRNAHSMALGLIGCYGNCNNPNLGVAEPPAAMLDSAVQLIAWQLGRQGIDPLSSAGYHNLSDIPAIAGGRDVTDTNSPGDRIYNLLPEIRTAVANINASPSPATVVSATPVPSPTPIGTPSPDSTLAAGTNPTATPASPSTKIHGAQEIQACRITNIVFDQESYLTGDTIDVNVKLADQYGLPLPGAVIDAEVTRNPSEIPIITVFEIDDRSGEYRAQYPATELPGYYTFAFTAFDPAGWRFAPCSGMIAVPVVEPVVDSPTPTATVLAGSPAPAPTSLPVAVDGATPTPTVISGTRLPTAVRITETATPTPTSTDGPTPTPTSTGTPTATATTNPGSQGTGVFFSPTSQSITVCDDQATVAIGVQDVTDMAAMQMDVLFNATTLQIIDADPGQEGVQVRVDPVFDSGFVAANDVDNDSGRLTFAVTLFNGNSISGSSGIIEIDFKPLAAGNSTLDLQNVILASAEARPIDHQTGSGNIEVLADCESGAVIQSGDFVLVSHSAASFPAGDTNGDSLVNSLDLAFLARQYGSPNPLADLTSDGLVDIRDIVLAASHYEPAAALAAAGQ